MQKENISEHDENYMSSDEFKQKYLSEVESLCEILGLDRDKIVRDYKGSLDQDELKESIIDDDLIFIHGVVYCISECENKQEKKRRSRKLYNHEGAKALFEAIYKMWEFREILDSQIYLPKRDYLGGRRSEPGKGDLIDIYALDEHGDSDSTFIWRNVVEDYADCKWPVVVKVKHNSGLTREDCIKVLRDLTETLEANFENCALAGPYDGFIVRGGGDEQVGQAERISDSDKELLRELENL